MVQYAFDELNRLSVVTDWTGTVSSYTYDAASQEQVASNPNGTRSSFTYDAAGRPTSVVHAGPGSSTLASFQYGYDLAGNRTSEVSLTGTTSYGYDVLDRLTGVTYANGEQVSYVYDGTGNRRTFDQLGFRQHQLQLRHG